MPGNVWWMLKMAWQSSKSIPFMCVVVALTHVAQSVLSLYAAPAILEAVEMHVSLKRLLLTICGFTFGLMVVSGLTAVLRNLVVYPRVFVRVGIVAEMNRKKGTTSYPNTEDPEVLKKEDKAAYATNSNDRAAEAIWSNLTDLLKNLLGFIIYLTLLADLHPAVVAVTVLTSAAGFFAEQRFHGWGYRHREESAELNHAIEYARKTAHNREFAKDLRIFGMTGWLEDVYDKSLKLFCDFTYREHRIYLWADMLEVALSFLRNGFAYAVLIGMVLKKGMSASAFVLYFAAASGFSEWVSGILHQCLTLRRYSLELCEVREYLDIPEQFRMSGGIPLTIDAGGDYELRLEDVSFRYPSAEKETIRHMNLTIHPGENWPL